MGDLTSSGQLGGDFRPGLPGRAAEYTRVYLR